MLRMSLHTEVLAENRSARYRTSMKIRNATQKDLAFLQEMLFEAVYWRSGADRPSLQEFSENSRFSNLLAGWGRPGDTALVAEDAGQKLGAAWFRFWTDANHSYGYVAADIPEIAIAVVAEHRARGVGRALLRALICEARAQSVRALSLSVDSANYARRLYESEGFVRVGEPGTHWTCVLQLDKRPMPHAA